MKTMDTSAASALSRKEYLKKYVNNVEDDKKKKRKKKQTKKSHTDSMNVLVVDEDPVWAKPVQIEDDNEEDDSAEEEQPQVNEDIEVKRMKRLEQIRSQRPYHALSEDGSGWVSISDVSSSVKLERDLSPSPRSQAQTNERHDSPDFSPPRRNRPQSQKFEDLGEEDISPPRRNRPQSQNTEDLGKDISPPRRNRPHSQNFDTSTDDISPPRRRRPQSQNIDVSVEDLSPPRRSKGLGMSKSSDLSPPRKNTRISRSPDLSPLRKSKGSSKEEARTGLLTAQEIKKDIERKKKEELIRYKQLDPSMTGRGAEPVYRDKQGKRMSKDEVLKLQKGEEKPQEKKLEWGKGLAQQREAEAREQELELEKNKPFARTRDDPELEKMLKERLRWGDPMAHLVKGNQSDMILEDFGDNEKMKESGFIIPQNIPSHSWIKRRIDAPPNRYGIKPGRHWDGVDRSNGTEKEYFKRTNDKQATERESYLWSVSDM